MVCLKSMFSRGLIVSLLLPAAAIMMWGCSDTRDCTCEPEPQPGSLLYFSSFEADTDTVGWTGYGDSWLADDAPEAGGSRSFGVSGGCPHPHARYKLEPLEVGGHYTIRFWGKTVDSTGAVWLGVEGSLEDGIGFSVEEPLWTLYSASESVWCPAGRSLWVELNSGGLIFSGGILVDLLEVVLVES